MDQYEVAAMAAVQPGAEGWRGRAAALTARLAPSAAACKAFRKKTLFVLTFRID